MDSDNEMKILIRASYPIIYIQSWEENRVVKALQKTVEEIPDDIARERAERGLPAPESKEKKIVLWSVTDGMVNAPKTGLSKDLRDPLRALEFIHDYRGEETIFVLRDFHPYMQDPAVVRKLRDLVQDLVSRGQDAEISRNAGKKTLILLSPALKIPTELEKDIAVVDYSLPSGDELDSILEGVLKNVEKDYKHVDVSNLEDGSREREKIVEAALGLTATEAANVFSKSLIKEKKFDIDVILSEKEQIIRKSGVLEFYRAGESFSDIGGLGELKAWLSKRKRAFTGEAREFGLPEPRGILLIGVPGCGKSLTAKAVGELWKRPLLRFDVGKVFAGLVGSSEENMRKAIRTAEAVAPSILWLDELEKGFSGTHSSSFSDAGTTARVFGSFVTWLQEKTSPVFVIATANNINLLPPELLRKGRFDEIFFVDLPSYEEREEIFRIHLNKRKRGPETFDIHGLAMCSEGFSGSEIEQAVISALYDAFDAGRELCTEDIYKSLEETVPLSQTMQEEISALREWAKTRARWASEEIAHHKATKGRQLDL